VTRSTRSLAASGAALVALALVTTADSARGDDTITHPGDHPAYNVEVEPHLLLGWDDVYAEGGWGLGVRFGIPIVDNGFVTTINNSVAISFGGDILHYDNCWYNGPCSANYIDIPVDLQWNFYVARRFTAFGELGLDVYHGFYADCPNGPTCPGRPLGGGIGIEPDIYIGGRYYFNQGIALTLRLGFPAVSFGVSFFP